MLRRLAVMGGPSGYLVGYHNRTLLTLVGPVLVARIPMFEEPDYAVLGSGDDVEMAGRQSVRAGTYP